MRGRWATRAVWRCLAVSSAFWIGTALPARADIRFGLAAEPFPPFTYKDASGNWAGWEVDLMMAICADLKEKCTSADVAWDGLIPSLQSRQIDVIWASMSITDKRREVIDFTRMYYISRVQLLGAKTGDKDITPAHLSGKTIGVQISSIHQRYAEAHFAPAGATVKTYQTQDEALEDLAAGRIDYVQGAAPVLAAFLASSQGAACCEIKADVPDDSAILGEGVGGGLRKGDTALKARLDGAITDLARSGEIARISDRFPGLSALIRTPQE